MDFFSGGSAIMDYAHKLKSLHGEFVSYKHAAFRFARY